MAYRLLSLSFLLLAGVLSPLAAPGQEYDAALPDYLSGPGYDGAERKLRPSAAADIIDQRLTTDERKRLHPDLQSVLADRRASPQPSAPRQTLALSEDATATFDVIISTEAPNSVPLWAVHSSFDDIITARITAAELEKLAGDSNVRYIDPGTENHLHLDVSVAATGAHLLHNGYVNDTAYRGQGTIIAVYDTGIDWTHPAFRDPDDPSRSRILAIWDQTLLRTEAENSPDGFHYGVEYRRDEIEAELRGHSSGHVRTKDAVGHGTHITGIAAGNAGGYTGMAPDADILVIKGGNSSFSETWIIDGLTYVEEVARRYGRPVVLNLSLGSSTGPRDGTRPYERKIDDFTAREGHVVITSAGNTGHLQIHRAGHLAAGHTTTITLEVPHYLPSHGAGADDFTLDIWASNGSDITAAVTSPNGITFMQTSGRTGHHTDESDGRITLNNTVSIFNQDRNISLSVSGMNGKNIPVSGMWTVELTAEEEDASFDAWLTNPAIGNPGQRIRLVDGDTRSTLSMPGTARSAISVGSYVTKSSWLRGESGLTGSSSLRRDERSTFSSEGPTRDGRIKPELVAPGEGIASAISRDGWIGRGTLDQDYGVAHGTSMAAPHVAGASAILLGIAPHLTYEDIRDLLTASALQSEISKNVPDAAWGFGRLDVLEAVNRHLRSGSSIKREILTYDHGADRSFTLTTGSKLSLRFTPSLSGSLASFLVQATYRDQAQGYLIAEVYSDIDGLPHKSLGSATAFSFEEIHRNQFTVLNAGAADVQVLEDTDYHLILSTARGSDPIDIYTSEPPPQTSGRTLEFSSEWLHLGRNVSVRPEIVQQSGLSLLSVEMNTFEASTEAGDVRLYWTTTAEFGTTGFEVQKSRSGFFETVGFVEGYGTSDALRTYEYRLVNLPPGSHSFRLKQMHHDGSNTFTPEVEVHITHPETYHLVGAYPNPFHQSASLELSVPATQDVRIELFDGLGRSVSIIHDGVVVAYENRQFKLEAENFPSGTYYYRISGETFHVTRPVIIVR